MNYNTMKLSTLRKMAKDNKVEGYEEMERVDLIKAIKPKPEEESKKVEDEKEEERIKPEAEVMKKEEIVDESEPEEESKIITGFMMSKASVNSKAANMKMKLDRQPKVSVLIPLEGDKFGATFPVTLNGLRMNILKGIYVEVPKQVAEIIQETQKQTVEALAGPMRTLPKDGFPGKTDGLPMKFDGDFSALSR